TKTDLVDLSTLDKIKTWLKQELQPGVKIVTASQGEIDPNLLLGFNAAVEDNLDSRHSHHDHEAEHEHDDNINSVELILDAAFEPQVLIEQLKQLLQSQEIYRVKGFVNVPNKPMRLVLQGVGNRFDTFYDRLWKINEPRQTRLVLIGHNLDRHIVETFLSHTALI
ncbi:MAG: GTP-binding protein, partial [Waterburya sp.]